MTIIFIYNIHHNNGIRETLASFVNILVGDLALCNNRYNGHQYKNDETLGDHYHIF